MRTFVFSTVCGQIIEKWFMHNKKSGMKNVNTPRPALCAVSWLLHPGSAVSPSSQQQRGTSRAENPSSAFASPFLLPTEAISQRRARTEAPFCPRNLQAADIVPGWPCYQPQCAETLSPIYILVRWDLPNSEQKAKLVQQNFGLWVSQHAFWISNPGASWLGTVRTVSQSGPLWDVRTWGFSLTSIGVWLAITPTLEKSKWLSGPLLMTFKSLSIK